ncbi:hypothetical protein [Alkaliphilus serpentinus]|uniref:hypothetical protein n=1 Tax=Alkaliphilus serpentinus TaxID=1482731 RepID=UPI0018656E84|nr:hypothetical protein [Alkaliphilus serpentinus]
MVFLYILLCIGLLFFISWLIGIIRETHTKVVNMEEKIKMIEKMLKEALSKE